jgi:carbonic anhydrase/acetyltransferase-like protein (isoleucine patch superfamily)
MLVERNGKAPRVDSTTRVADSARIVGNVTIGPRCYIDHQVVIESAGPPVHIGEGVIIFPGSVVRSVGGRSRPAFDVVVGDWTLIAPHSTVTGCHIGSYCYVATAAIVLQGASVGDYSRLGVGSIVHAKTALPEGTRVGMRHVAAPRREGFISTADIEEARQAVGAAGFFETAFGLEETDSADLHERVMRRLLDEVHAWEDRPL